MGLFSRRKKEESVVSSAPKGFNELEVKSVLPLTPESVKVSFDIPESLRKEYGFVPGQYLNISAMIGGAEERRSYSICSGEGEDIAVAIKRINNGKISNWANDELKAGDKVYVSVPMGNFRLESGLKNIVAFAAGSGITPIISMAKDLKRNGGNMKLFYGNRTSQTIMFAGDFDALDNVAVTHYLTAEEKQGCQAGRLDKEAISAIVKSDLTILRSEAFYLCGPETMIKAGIDVLTLFGVPKNKIHYELYTTPVVLVEDKPVEVSDFTGESKVTVILDDEEIRFSLDASGKTILDAVNKEGYDAPYSCRGGVCCTCRAKVLKGKVTMNLNYSLTDQEVAEGFVLTCQSHPASPEVILSYDE